MFSGPPLPLQPDLPLSQLFAWAQPAGTLGAWVRGSARALHVYEIAGHGSRVLVSSDLGFLLARCNRIALRESRSAVVLEADVVIRWRALQVAIAAPFLPGLARLQGIFPGLTIIADTVVIPLATETPEAVLAHCLAEKLPVSGSRLVYSHHP